MPAHACGGHDQETVVDVPALPCDATVRLQAIEFCRSPIVENFLA